MEGDIVDRHARGELGRLFAVEGIPVAARGNAPVIISARESIWYIAKGRVDLFAMNATATRHHLAAFHEGDLLWGSPVRGESAQLLCAAIGEATLLQIEPARFVDLVHASDAIDEASEHVDRWIRTVARAIGRAWPRPPLDHLVSDAGAIQLTDGMRCGAAKSRVAWLSPSTSEALILGVEPFPSGAALPVTEDLWMEACGTTALSVTTTRDLLTSDALAASLRAFQHAMLRCSSLQRAAAELDELTRRARQAEHDDTVRRAVLLRMAAAMEPASAGATRIEARSSLGFAAAEVGRAMGFEIRDTDVAERGTPRMVADLARRNGFRVRRVLLRDRWWQKDHGPLLGMAGEDLRPVALIHEGGRYVVRDSTAPDKVVVRERDAEGVSPHAFAFYRPLPSGTLSIRGLLRFGSFGAAKDYTTFAVVTLLWSAVGLLPPVITGVIFDHVVPDRDVPLLAQLTIALSAVALATALFDVARKQSYMRLETRIGHAVQAAVWDRLLRLPVPFFRRFAAGELAVRANAIDAVRRTLTGVLVSSMVGGVFAAFLAVMLFRYSVSLALVALLMGGIAATATLIAGVLKVRHQRRVIDLYVYLSGLVLQILMGVAKIRVAGAESRAFSVWATTFARQKEFDARSQKVDVVLKAFNTAFPMAATVAMFWMFLAEVGRPGGLSLGDFVAFQYAFAMMMATTVQISASIVQAVAVLPEVEQARPILEALPEESDARSPVAMTHGAVDFSHVSFRYDNDAQLVLDDVSIHAGAREFVALVGPSGAGKSTIFRLLLGFEQPSAGAIYYDDRDLAGLDLQSVRRSIGVVLQNGRLMAGDIFSNIAGSSPLTLDDVWEVARLAGLADDIQKMPMGMHTVLPEGATTLSGGQRQRLLIARALALRPRLLLFDEATSALDNRTQEVINESLSRLDVTRIVIAHRLSTVRNADRIYVLSGGRIIESGTCDDLVRKGGAFAELSRRQSLEEHA